MAHALLSRPHRCTCTKNTSNIRSAAFSLSSLLPSASLQFPELSIVIRTLVNSSFAQTRAVLFAFYCTSNSNYYLSLVDFCDSSYLLARAYLLPVLFEAFGSSCLFVFTSFLGCSCNSSSTNTATNRQRISSNVPSITSVGLASFPSATFYRKRVVESAPVALINCDLALPDTFPDVQPLQQPYDFLCSLYPLDTFGNLIDEFISYYFILILYCLILPPSLNLTITQSNDNGCHSTLLHPPHFLQRQDRSPPRFMGQLLRPASSFQRRQQVRRMEGYL